MSQNTSTSQPNIQEIFQAMRESHGKTPTKQDQKQIQEAYEYAQRAHEGQVRASGEPYFNHVFATAVNCARFGMDTKTVIAGMLHDVIEDTPVTEADIKKDFGEEILFLVNGVTKLGTLKYRGAERHIESLRKFFIAVAKDLRVVIIKLADRLHNVQTLQYLRPDKAKRIALETIEIHSQLAYRLGMGKLTKELQEYAFPFAYPEESKQVEALLKHRKKTDEKYLDKVFKSLMNELVKHKIKILKTDYRIKGKYSLFKKLQRKDMDIEKIYDIVALRVVVKSLEDCYKVLGLIHSMWRPLPGRIKDYIALPKNNGYQSIHTTIFTGDGGIAEIQIRDEEMHAFAEYGFASHMLYKKKTHSEQIRAEDYEWVSQLHDMNGQDLQGEQFLESLKTDFFTERIFVFTPKGDIIDLPLGSSCLDFAFAVHSDIGMHATGAKINGKFVALKTELKSSDIVEIIHDKRNGHPTSKWIDYVKTSLAKKHIKNYLKEHSLLTRFFGSTS
jgi:GTP diphosphokinase / guanosine-3',5'-bis(diphosphate) 3'-diphosphatase